jgi:hypothetical protein
MTAEIDAQPRLKVRLTIDLASDNMRLVAPGGMLKWGRCDFDLNPSRGEPADYWITHYAAKYDKALCARENTLFISGEPPSKKVYPKKFYRQFHRLVDTHTQSGHPRVTVHSLGIFWQVGIDHELGDYRYGYDALVALACPPKENKISVVCSATSKTPGQRRRLALLERLKMEFGDDLIHYGRGFQPVNDKMDALLPCRYNLVLENSESPHYWTEKLSDAYLAWAHPIYVGCPNLDEYFHPDSFTRIASDDHETAVRVIRGLLTKPPGEAETQLIAVARHRILNDYNPFCLYARWAEEFYQPDRPQELLTIRSHKDFRPYGRGLLHRLRGWKAK